MPKNKIFYELINLKYNDKSKYLINILKSKNKNLINYIDNKLKLLMYKNKPPITKKQYMKAKKILKEEYEYWISRTADLENLWKF
jgi:hypothetical protein